MFYFNYIKFHYIISIKFQPCLVPATIFVALVFFHRKKRKATVTPTMKRNEATPAIAPICTSSKK